MAASSLADAGVSPPAASQHGNNTLHQHHRIVAYPPLLSTNVPVRYQCRHFRGQWRNAIRGRHIHRLRCCASACLASALLNRINRSGQYPARLSREALVNTHWFAAAPTTLVGILIPGKSCRSATTDDLEINDHSTAYAFRAPAFGWCS